MKPDTNKDALVQVAIVLLEEFLRLHEAARSGKTEDTDRLETIEVVSPEALRHLKGYQGDPALMALVSRAQAVWNRLYDQAVRDAME